MEGSAEELIISLIGQQAFDQMMRFLAMQEQAEANLIRFNELTSKLGGGSTFRDMAEAQAVVNKAQAEGAVALRQYNESFKQANSIVEQGIAFKQSFNGTSRETINVILQLARVQTEQSKQALNSSKIETEQLKQKLLQIKLNADEEKKAAVIAAEASKLKQKSLREEAELLRLIQEEQREKQVADERQLGIEIEKEEQLRRQIALWNQLLAAEDAAKSLGGTTVVNRDSLNQPIAQPALDRYAASARTADQIAAEKEEIALLTTEVEVNTVATTVNTNAKQKAGITAAEYKAIMAGEATLLKDGTVAFNQNTTAAQQNYSKAQATVLRAGQIKTELAGVAAQLRANASAFQSSSINEDAYNQNTLKLTATQMALKEESKLVNTSLVQQGLAAETSGRAMLSLQGIITRIGSTLTRFVASFVIFTVIGKALQVAIEYLDLFGKKADEAAEAESRFLSAIKQTNEELALHDNTVDRETKLNIARAKARGASEKELTEIKKKGIDERLALTRDEIKKEIENVGYYLDLKNKLEHGMTFDDKNATLPNVIKNLDATRKTLQELSERQKDLEAEREEQDLNLQTKENKPKRMALGNTFYQQDINAEKKLLEERSKNRQADLKEDESYFERIANDEKQSLDVRIGAYRTYLEDKKALIREEKDTAIAVAKNTIADLNKEEARNESLIGSGKLTAVQKGNLQEKNKLIVEQIKGLNAEIIRLANERVQQQKTVEEDGDKAIQTITDNASAKYLKGVEAQLSAIDNLYNAAKKGQIDALAGKLNAGSGSDAFNDYLGKYRAFKQQETALEEVYNIKVLQARQSVLDKALEYAKEHQLDLTKLQERADKNAQSLRDAETKAIKQAYSEREQAARDLHNVEKQFATEALSSIKTIFDATYQGQIKAYDELISKAKDKATTDEEAYKSSAQYAIDSEDERYRKLTAIKTNALKQEEDLTEAQNKIKRKQAALDTAITVAGILAKAAEAEFDLSAKAASASATGALLLADPLTAAYAPVAFGAAADIAAEEFIVAGIAGLQIAAAIAAAPKFFAGTKDSGARGLAVVGDGGRPEVITTHDGQAFVTPNVPTLVNMPAHSIVHKSIEDFMRESQYASLSNIKSLRGRMQDDGLSTMEMERLLKQVVKGVNAVAEKPPVIVKPADVWNYPYAFKK